MFVNVWPQRKYWARQHLDWSRIEQNRGLACLDQTIAHCKKLNSWYFTSTKGPQRTCLIMKNTLIKRATERKFLGLKMNCLMIWNTCTWKRQQNIMRIRQNEWYLPFSAIKLMYVSLKLIFPQIFSLELQNWGLQEIAYQNYKKQALRTMTRSSYNAHTRHFFKQMLLLKDISKFW